MALNGIAYRAHAIPFAMDMHVLPETAVSQSAPALASDPVLRTDNLIRGAGGSATFLSTCPAQLNNASRGMASFGMNASPLRSSTTGQRPICPVTEVRDAFVGY